MAKNTQTSHPCTATAESRKLSIAPVVKALEDAFDKANAYFYEGKLVRPVITFTADEKKKSYGHFVMGEIWHEGEENRAELNIACNTIEDHAQVIGTLLHEMVHAYCWQNGLKDTSNRGVYHNAVFQREANAHGLDLQEKGKYGWTGHVLSESGKAFLASIDGDLGALKRDTLGKTKVAKKRAQNFRYTCPECGAIVRSTRLLNVMCGDCMIQMDID